MFILQLARIQTDYVAEKLKTLYPDVHLEIGEKKLRCTQKHTITHSSSSLGCFLPLCLSLLSPSAFQSPNKQDIVFGSGWVKLHNWTHRQFSVFRH